MKDTNYSIPRTRLFFNNYLPGAIMSHRHGMYGYVVGTNSRQEQVDKVNYSLLKEVVGEQIELWHGMGGDVDGSLESAIENSTLVVRAPDEIYIRPIPLMLECGRCHLIQLNNGREKEVISKLSRIAHGEGPTLFCPKCNGKMKQVRFMNIHRCGSVDPVTPPFQARGRQLKLLDGGTFYSTYWIDYQTGQNYGNLIAPKCKRCTQDGLNGGTCRGAVMRDGRNESFYPRLTQYISMTQETTELLENVASLDRGQEELGWAIICGILGLQDQQMIRNNLQVMVGGTASSGDLEDLLAKKKQFQEKISTLKTIGDMVDVIESVRDRINELDAQIQQAQGLFSIAEQYLSDLNVLPELAQSRRAREAALIAGEFQSLSLQEHQAEESDPAQQAIIKENVNQLNQRKGVRELRYIQDVSVVLAAIGFSRELDNPSTSPHEVAVRLNSFIDEISDDLVGKTPVYVVPANTEAIHVRLDPCAVLRWAKTSLGWHVDDTTIMDDPKRAHAYILQAVPMLSMPPSVAYNEAKLKNNNHCINLLGLIHTMAHMLMRSAKQGSGYNENSLMEYIFPADLSFLIYVTSTTDYTTGGLLSLFKHNLPDWFDIANQDSLNCLYDPICTQSGGSCHGCTQKAIGCETFNHGLSRAYLHGGTVIYPNGQADTIQIGFWNE